MSNDIILQIQNSLANVQQGIDADTAAVAGSSGGKRISIKGGVFRKYANGKEVAAVPDRFMNIVFAKMAPHPSRMYYPGAYEEGVKTAPTCWSSESVTPDAEVKTPQAAACKTCPMSVKGSGRDGKSTACRLSWRTAVVLPNDPAGDLMQLVIPAASVWGDEFNGTRPFLPYIRYLASNNISAGRVVTKMEFDLRRPSPTLLFSPVAAVPPEHLDLIAVQAKTPAAEMAIKLTVFQTDDAGKDEVEVPAHATAAAVQHEEPVPEPTLRVEPKDEAPVEDKKEVSSVIKKWAKK